MPDTSPGTMFANVCTALGRSVGATLGRALSRPALMIDGKIVAFEMRGMLVVKLPLDQRERLLAAGNAQPMRTGTRVMREWVALPASTENAWIAAAEASARYVMSLPAAPRRKRPVAPKRR